MGTEQPQRSTTEPRHIEASERACKALSLRLRGRSYRAIAQALDVSLSTAHSYVAQALASIRTQTAETAQQLRDLEMLKLDQLECKLWQAMKETSAADAAKLANSIRSISESRRKLLGIDAPVRVETTGNLYTVLDASPDCPEWGRPSQGAKQ